MIPYGRQTVEEDDVAAVCDVLRSDFLTQGPAVPVFEQSVAEYCGVAHAVAVSSATAALHISCLALGLGPRDWLWTSPITFVASANCALYCGAQVDFVDIDAATLNMSATALEAKLAAAARAGRLPKVLVPVAFGGRPCDMQRIADLCLRHGVAVLEDASHAIGSEHHGSRTGACLNARLSVFSFHPVKIVTSAEGGMILTRDAALAAKLRLLRNHGITRDAAEMTAPAGGWYYEQTMLGYNYRMNDLQGALGTSQMRRLGAFVERRRQLARRYDALLGDLPVVLPPADDGIRSSWHLYVVQLRDHPRLAIYDAMRRAQIGVNVHYIPVHLQPFYRRLGFAPGDFPQAEAYYDRALSLPLYPGMSDGDQDRVAGALRRALTA
jgi:UDP-4-amino-4,6-dideoxy-N-acetyl-beta-L-altrosamine transaminase